MVGMLIATCERVAVDWHDFFRELFCRGLGTFGNVVGWPELAPTIPRYSTITPMPDANLGHCRRSTVSRGKSRVCESDEKVIGTIFYFKEKRRAPELTLAEGD